MSSSKMVNPNNAKEFIGFLTQEENESILNFAKNNSLWKPRGDGFWDGRTLNTFEIFFEDEQVGRMLYDIKDRILKTIKKSYKITDEIYCDLLQVTRWFSGMEQPPHSDNMQGTEHASVHQHRSYGVVIYLNNDFEGGETFYPQHNFQIMPEPKKMAVHPASTDHMHGVTKIAGNTRYTITTFITFDKNKSMP